MLAQRPATHAATNQERLWTNELLRGKARR